MSKTETIAPAPTAETPSVRAAGTRKKPWLPWLVMALRIVLCLVFGLPLVFLIVNSFKPDSAIFGDLGSINAFLPVGDLSLDNYTAAFRRAPVGLFVFN